MEWPRRGVKTPVKAVAVLAPFGRRLPYLVLNVTCLIRFIIHYISHISAGRHRLSLPSLTESGSPFVITLLFRLASTVLHSILQFAVAH